MTILEIGERSSGTLKPDDLARAMLEDANAVLASRLIEDLESVIDDPEAADAMTIVNEAIDDLNECCPAYCYYGFHMGDGSALGVWPDTFAIETDMQTDEILMISDLVDLLEKSVSETTQDYALLTNDHGNMTLYRLTLHGPQEVWAIV